MIRNHALRCGIKKLSITEHCSKKDSPAEPFKRSHRRQKSSFFFKLFTTVNFVKTSCREAKSEQRRVDEDKNEEATAK